MVLRFRSLLNSKMLKLSTDNEFHYLIIGDENTDMIKCVSTCDTIKKKENLAKPD